MTKQQIKEIIKLLKAHRVQEEKKDNAWEKYAEIEFKEQHTPWLNKGELDLTLKVIEKIDEELSDMLSYLFYEVWDWKRDKYCVRIGDGTIKEKNIKRKDLEKYIINEYGK